MKIYSDKFSQNEFSASKEPFFVFDLDSVFFTSRSHVDAYVPEGEDRISDVLVDISGQTQKINPDQAVSSIGTMTVRLADPLIRLENIFDFSEQIQAWSSVNITKIADDRIAPDGTGTMTKIIPTTTAASHGVYDVFTASTGEKKVCSIWAIADGYDFLEISLWSPSEGYIEETVFDVLNGTVVSGDGIIESIDAGIFKCTFITSGISTDALNLVYFNVRETAGTRVFSGNAVDGVHMWGGSMTTGGVIREYTKTTTVAYETPVFSRPVSEKINEKLKLHGRGMRGKIGKIYVGYKGLTFDQYDLRLTYVVDSMTFKDGVYTVKLSDIQRQQRKRVFVPDETTLLSTLMVDDVLIPVSTLTATKFQAVSHGGEWSSWPNDSVGYVKIEKEVIVHSGLAFDTVNGWHLPILERGALGTRVEEHKVDESKSISKRRKVVEHIFIEGAAPKIAYALLTGVLLNGSSPEDSFPDHWHLGISSDFVRLTDFEDIGDDYWNPSDDSGKFVRIENPGGVDGKQFIEKELMLWMGSYMPIYSTGEIGLKRLSKILSDSGYKVIYDQLNIVGYSDLRHDMRSVINQISVLWNWVDARDDFTKEALMIDADSISIHGKADEKVFKFKSIHTGLHTDEDILKHFDTIRDRFSGPPLLLSLTLAPSQSAIEVGDTVRVKHENIRDFNALDGVLDRTFEVQQVTSNWMTGQLKISLFGSSQAAGTLAPTTLTPVMNDAWYLSAGVELSTVLTIVSGVVTVNGALTGHADDVNNAIYYYDGDLEIAVGVTVTITQSVQLRIKGHLTINGLIDGVGSGAAGGAGTAQYEDATTNDSYSIYGTAPEFQKKELDFHGPVMGGFGMTNPPGVFDLMGTVFGFYPSGWLGAFAMVSVPFYDLKNPDGDSLTGYPKRLHGVGGGGGMPLIERTGIDVGVANIKASGGNGGTGGAGLMIVSRGLSFGTSIGIKLNGDSGSLGGFYDASRHPVSGTTRFHAGSGGAGACGALLVMLDGNVTSPDLTSSTVELNYGDQVVPSGAYVMDGLELARLRTGQNALIRNWPYDETVLAGTPFKGFDGIDSIESAQRIQYIPVQSVPIQDPENFPDAVPGVYRDLLFFQGASPVVAQTGYGREVDITDDGTRFLVSSFSSTVAVTVQVVRSVSNPVIEQTISDPSIPTTTVSGWGERCELSHGGDRLMAATAASKPGVLNSQGEIWIYSRTGVTWSLEQTLAAGTPVAVGQFGLGAKADGDFNSLITKHDDGSANWEIQYWARSGVVWSYQSKLPVPSGVSATYVQTEEIAISSNGDYILASDKNRTVDGVVNVGAVYLFQRNGVNWNQLVTLTPIEGTDYRWGNDIAINGNGTAFAVSHTTKKDSGYKIAIYHRAGSAIKLVQTIFHESSSAIFSPISFSENGLVLLVYESVSGLAQIYKRGSVEQEFNLFQEIQNTDDGSWGAAESFALSKSGGFLITGNTSTDVGAANSGSVHAYQLTADAQ